MAFTYNASTSILNALTGKAQNVSLLSNCYLGLSSTAPEKDGSNFTEPEASTGYARAVVGLANQAATQVMGTPSEGSITNKDIIFFPEAGTSWGTLTHFGLFTAPTGGTLILYGSLSTPITVAANYVPLFRAGNFTLNLS